MIVFNSSVNMVEVLENFMEFFVHESCGQCTPCREGNLRLMHAAEDIITGSVSCRECIAPFFELADAMKASSKCGLGQTSANCFVDIISNFVELSDECNCEECGCEGGDE